MSTMHIRQLFLIPLLLCIGCHWPGRRAASSEGRPLLRPELLNGLEFNIYKSYVGGSPTADIYLVSKGRKYALPDFASVGLLSMCVADLDADGSPELILTSSFGSGMISSSIHVCALKNGEIRITEAPVRLVNSYDLFVRKAGDQEVIVELGELQNGVFISTGIEFGKVSLDHNGNCVIEENPDTPDSVKERISRRPDPVISAP